jgi:2Fe-2S ferredoxin
MSSVRIIAPDGSSTVVECKPENSIMQSAVSQDAPGIVGECGGALMCSTCHVYLDATSWHRFPPPDEAEEEMLDAVAAERRETSRLSCQLVPDDNGSDPDHEIVVHAPQTQY